MIYTYDYYEVRARSEARLLFRFAFRANSTFVDRKKSAKSKLKNKLARVQPRHFPRCLIQNTLVLVVYMKV